MFEERGWFAEADARALRPADSVNERDHRGDAPKSSAGLNRSASVYSIVSCAAFLGMTEVSNRALS
jgi:hypothetical protein